MNHFALLIALGCAVGPSATPQSSIAEPSVAHQGVVSPERPVRGRAVFRVATVEERLHIVVDEPIPDSVQLRRVAPETFDHTAVADAPPADRPRTFTLVGANGSCEVTTHTRGFIDTFGARGAAFIVGEGACSGEPPVVAIEGRVTDARADFHRGAGQERSEEAAAWAERQLGVGMWTPDGRVSVYVEPLEGTDVEVVHAFTDVPRPGRSATLELLLRRGQQLLHRRTEANLVALVTISNQRYAVTVDETGRGELLPVD